MVSFVNIFIVKIFIYKSFFFNLAKQFSHSNENAISRKQKMFWRIQVSMLFKDMEELQQPGK